jgi:hypothetical protein
VGREGQSPHTSWSDAVAARQQRKDGLSLPGFPLEIVRNNRWDGKRRKENLEKTLKVSMFDHVVKV